MDSQYESVNVPDFDVVRSTQFVDDFTRGVCIHLFLGYQLQSNDANPSSSVDCTPRCLWYVRGQNEGHLDFRQEAMIFSFLFLQGFRVGQLAPQRFERTQVHCLPKSMLHEQSSL